MSQTCCQVIRRCCPIIKRPITKNQCLCLDTPCSGSLSLSLRNYTFNTSGIIIFDPTSNTMNGNFQIHNDTSNNPIGFTVINNPVTVTLTLQGQGQVVYSSTNQCCCCISILQNDGTPIDTFILSNTNNFDLHATVSADIGTIFTAYVSCNCGSVTLSDVTFTINCT